MKSQKRFGPDFQILSAFIRCYLRSMQGFDLQKNLTWLQSPRPSDRRISRNSGSASDTGGK
jgi:hypothetical protein